MKRRNFLKGLLTAPAIATVGCKALSMPSVMETEQTGLAIVDWNDGRFAAVSDTGILTTSSDGTTWTTREKQYADGRKQ